MISITVKGSEETLKTLKEYGSAGKAAGYRAIRRTVDGMITDISKEVRATYNVAKKQIDDRIKKEYPHDYNNLSGSIRVTAMDEQRSALPLILYGATARSTIGSVNVKTTVTRSQVARSQRMKNAGRTGVSFRVLTSGGKGFRSDAQIMRGGNSSWQVVRFQKGRKGTERILELRTLTISSMILGKRGILGRIKAAALKRLNTNAQSALEYYLANPDKISRRAE